MLYKIGICDDDRHFLDSLDLALQKYEQLNALNFQIFAFTSGEELLSEYRQQHFNLLFLDMEMDGLSGIEVAEKLRLLGDDINIIYTTAYEKYAFAAFQVNAISYLSKPIADDALFAAMDRVFHYLDLQVALADTRDAYIVVETRFDTFQISYDEILYISKIRNSLVFSTTKGDYSVYMNIKDILKKLDTSIFVKINKGQIINWTKITSLHDGVAFIDGVELPVSRSHSTQLKRRYQQELEQLLRIEEHDLLLK